MRYLLLASSPAELAHSSAHGPVHGSADSPAHDPAHSPAPSPAHSPAPSPAHGPAPSPADSPTHSPAPSPAPSPTHSAPHSEAAAAFCALLEDELAASSELEWYEVLAPQPLGQIIEPDGSMNEDAHTEWALTRVWAVRVSEVARAHQLASLIARELGARVEVRECLAGAQRP